MPHCLPSGQMVRADDCCVRYNHTAECIIWNAWYYSGMEYNSEYYLFGNYKGFQFKINHIFWSYDFVSHINFWHVICQKVCSLNLVTNSGIHSCQSEATLVNAHLAQNGVLMYIKSRSWDRIQIRNVQGVVNLGWMRGCHFGNCCGMKQVSIVV